MAVLSVRSQVSLVRAGRTATALDLLGEGGQGAVFDAVVDGTTDHFALKWYPTMKPGTPARAAIEDLVERGSPDPRFLWPLDIATREGDDGFGYVMPLRDASSVGFSALIRPRNRIDLPLSTTFLLGMHLADAFLVLHNQGLCYRDINFGNVFFDPASGRPQICDNDNVGVDGESRSAVYGTRKFMAPEIVRREAAPSAATDRYSLSVLLFYLLMLGHPLVGRRELDFPIWSNEAEESLLGSQPRFLFDPDDDSNRPLPEHHGAVLDNWDAYPEDIRKLFRQAFTDGLRDPLHGRVAESMWRSTLARWCDRVMACSSCGAETFWDPSQADTPCWSCAAPTEAPLRLRIDSREVVLGPNAVVQPHHFNHPYDLSTVLADVVAHPTKPGHRGLRNRTDQSWQIETPAGEQLTVDPGRSVGLIPDTAIDMIGRRVVVVG